MNQYQETSDGDFEFNNMTIPNSPGNRHYQKMQQAISDGDAEILPFVLLDPPYDMPSMQEQLDVLLEKATLTGDAKAIKDKVLNRPGR